MKYLINWIKKELKPEKYIKAVTTNSNYFYINNIKIRVSDHLTNSNDNDLQIIVINDLFNKNKQYLIKELDYPNIITVNNVKDVKIVIYTYLFHFKNIYSSKKYVKNTEDIKTDNPVVIDNSKINDIVNEIKSNTIISNENETLLYNYLCNTLPQFKSIGIKLYRYSLGIIKSGKSLNDYINIMNITFPNENKSKWCAKKYIDLQNKIEQFITNYYITNINTEQENFNNIIKKINNDTKITEKEDIMLSSALGHIMPNYIKDGSTYKCCTTKQKEAIRNMFINKIPLNIVVNFYDNILYRDGKKMLPETLQLKEIVKNFIKKYKNGIITYDINELLHKDENIIEEIKEETKEEKLVDQSNEIDVTYLTNSKEFIQNDIDNLNLYNVSDISETFDSNQLSIINEVLLIAEENRTTSFETKKIRDIFREHYKSRYSRWTNTQRDIVANIIAVEAMNVSEADYIINRMFPKTAFNWPVTQFCRKYIKQYCDRLKSLRNAI